MGEDQTSFEYRLLQNGCVVLYHSPFLMEEHSSLLVRSGWEFKEAYVGEKGTVEEFFDQVALALGFPGYFGKNLDAFRDCLSDIPFPETGRLVLGLTRFDLVSKHDSKFAHAVLDICAEAERNWLMEGKRILFLVQSSNPDLHFPEVGGTPVVWNFQEWLNADRKKNLL